MNQDLFNQSIAELDALIAKYSNNRICTTDYHLATRGIDLASIFEMSTQTLSAAERIGGIGSPYHNQAREVIEKKKEVVQPQMLLGILRALKENLVNGYLETITESIHGEIFGDILGQAERLLENEPSTTAAAVIAGVSLETHLRALCQKHGIDTDITNDKGNLKPKKADAMNADLTKTRVYQGDIQKDVSAWLGKRNKAAHGRDTDATKKEIQLMIEGIRYFQRRYPA